MDAAALKASLVHTANVPVVFTIADDFDPRSRPQRTPNTHAHSSQLLAESARNAHEMDLDEELSIERVYTWEEVVKNPQHHEKLKRLYDMKYQMTGKRLFPFEVRAALGTFFCPPRIQDNELFKYGRENTEYQEPVAKHIVDTVLTAVQEDPQLGPEAKEYLTQWAEMITEDKSGVLLRQLYQEMDVKFTREKKVWTEELRLRARPPRQHSSAPPAAPAPAPASSAQLYSNNSGATRGPAPTAATPTAQSSLGQDKPTEDVPAVQDTVEDYIELDQDLARKRRELERFQAFEMHVEETEHDRVYNTLSMRLFCYALLVVYAISLVFSVWCIDAWGIIIPGLYTLAVGLWGLSITAVMPGYWSLDFYTVISWIAVFSYSVYALLRTFIYDFGGCSVEDWAELFYWLIWAFGLAVSVFATTILALRKRAEDWKAQQDAGTIRKAALGKSS